MKKKYINKLKLLHLKKYMQSEICSGSTVIMGLTL